MELPLFQIDLVADRPIYARADLLRGFFASQYPNEVLFHHHSGEKLVYQYPLIQYKILYGVGIVIGIANGIKTLETVPLNLRTLKLNEHTYPIMENRYTRTVEPFQDVTRPRTYRFVTPWLALNTRNFKKYRNSTFERKQDILRRILIGNILSMSKTLGHRVQKRLETSLDVREVDVVLDSVARIGFIGSFSINFEIPPLLGLGKSVSRGLGTIISLKDDNHRLKIVKKKIKRLNGYPRRDARSTLF